MIPPTLPPPLPAAEKSVSKSALLASIMAMLSPFILLGLALAFGFFEAKGWPTGEGRAAAMLVWLIAGMIFALGLGASFFATVGKSGQTSTGVQVRGVAGLFLHALVLLMLLQKGMELQKGMAAQRKQRMDDAFAAVKKINEEARQGRFEGDETISGQQHLKRLQQEYVKASADLAGTDKLIFEEGAAYTGRLQVEMKKYEECVRRMRESKVLSPQANDSREKISQNRQVVQDFMAANNTFSNFVYRAADHFEKELLARKLPDQLIRQTMVGFNRTSSVRKPYILQIRKTDAQIGQATLGMLDILDTWSGKWKIESATGMLLLPDDDAIAKYEELLAEVDEASEEQTKAQDQLLSFKE